MKIKTLGWLWASLPLTGLVQGCKLANFEIPSVNYHAVRTTFNRPEKIPESAKIAASYMFNGQGEMLVVVFNCTDEVITVDQTKSFLINTDGVSQSYYDPTVYSSTSGNYTSSTSGHSFNLGGIANVLGIGGVVGNLLGATTVGSSTTTGTFGASTVTVQDQPKLSIGPHGKIVMSKQFKVTGVGAKHPEGSWTDIKPERANQKFSVCITYQIEGEDAQDKMVTDFYISSCLNIQIPNGKVSEGVKRIYAQKPDALAEPVYFFHIDNNFNDLKYAIQVNIWLDSQWSTDSRVYDTYFQGYLMDYK